MPSFLKSSAFEKEVITFSIAILSSTRFNQYRARDVYNLEGKFELAEMDAVDWREMAGPHPYGSRKQAQA